MKYTKEQAMHLQDKINNMLAVVAARIELGESEKGTKEWINKIADFLNTLEIEGEDE